MDFNRREVLKNIFYSGVCVAGPLVLFTGMSRENDLSYQSSFRVNHLEGDMYELNGWVITLSDLKTIQ